MEGYIKLHRQFLEWEWYADAIVSRVFLHCLLRANHEARKWQGQKIERGSFITSYQKLSTETGLSIQNIRTALKKLKSTGELTSSQGGSNTMITIKNWDKWQIANTLSNTELTSNQHRANTELTTNKNDKNDKEVVEQKIFDDINNSTSSPISINDNSYLGEYSNVVLTKRQLGKLKSIITKDELLMQLINELSINIAANKEKIFDTKYPDAHFVRIVTYFKHWQNRNKTTQETKGGYNSYAQR